MDSSVKEMREAAVDVAGKIGCIGIGDCVEQWGRVGDRIGKKVDG